MPIQFGKSKAVEDSMLPGTPKPTRTSSMYTQPKPDDVPDWIKQQIAPSQRPLTNAPTPDLSQLPPWLQQQIGPSYRGADNAPVRRPVTPYQPSAVESGARGVMGFINQAATNLFPDTYQQGAQEWRRQMGMPPAYVQQQIAPSWRPANNGPTPNLYPAQPGMPDLTYWWKVATNVGKRMQTGMPFQKALGVELAPMGITPANVKATFNTLNAITPAQPAADWVAAMSFGVQQPKPEPQPYTPGQPHSRPEVYMYAGDRVRRVSAEEANKVHPNPVSPYGFPSVRYGPGPNMQEVDPWAKNFRFGSGSGPTGQGSVTPVQDWTRLNDVLSWYNSPASLTYEQLGLKNPYLRSDGSWDFSGGGTRWYYPRYYGDWSYGGGGGGGYSYDPQPATWYNNMVSWNINRPWTQG